MKRRTVKTAAPYALGVLALVAVVTVVLASTVWSGEDSTDEIVARVAGATITDADYRRAYTKYLGDTGLPDAPERRAGFLERLVGIQLVVADARDRSLHEVEEYKRTLKRVKEKMMVDFFVQRTALDTLEAREPELREMFLRMNTSIKARHLYAQTLPEAVALKARLDAGETFEDLASEVFQNTELADNGGSLGYFGFDEMDPAFEDAAYAMEIGAISEPVRTAHGYSIIQVEDRQPKPIVTENEYATKKDRVAQYVLYRKHAKARKALAAAIVEEADISFHPGGVATLVGFIDGTVQIDVETPSPEILAQPLVSFTRLGELVGWSVGDFRELALTASPEQREAVQSEAQLREFVAGLVARNVMVARFGAAGWESDAEFSRVLGDTADEMLYELAWNGHVEGIEVSADSVRAYFDQHGHEFQAERTLVLDEVITHTLAEARTAKEALKAEPFAEVARRLSTRPGADETGGRLGSVTRAQLGVLADTLFSAPVGEILGPLEVAGRYGIFRVTERTPPAAASFEDIATDLEKLLRQTATREHMRTLVDSLRQKYPVETDVAAVKQMQLVKAST